MVKPRGRTMSSIQVVTPLKTPSPMKKISIVKPEVPVAQGLPHAIEDQRSHFITGGRGRRRRVLADEDQEHGRAHDRDHAVDHQRRGHAQSEQEQGRQGQRHNLPAVHAERAQP